MGKATRFRSAKLVSGSTPARLAGTGRRLVSADDRPVYLASGHNVLTMK